LLLLLLSDMKMYCVGESPDVTKFILSLVKTGKLFQTLM